VYDETEQFKYSSIARQAPTRTNYVLAERKEEYAPLLALDEFNPYPDTQTARAIKMQIAQYRCRYCRPTVA
jgi:hypothetical protein